MRESSKTFEKKLIQPSLMTSKFFATIALSIIFIAGTFVFAEVRYTITDLGTLGGNTSRGYGINDLGQVSGYSKLSDGTNHAFRWDSNETNGTTGVIVDLGVLSGSTSSTAYSINNRGHVAGSSNGIVFLHDGANMHVISSNPDYSYSTNSINEKGQIAGHYRTSESGTFRGFRWDPDAPGSTTGIMNDIGNIGPTNTWVHHINDNGQVCGSGPHFVPGYEFGYLTEPNSTIHYIDSIILEAVAFGYISQGYASNNRQHAVGYSRHHEGFKRACMWYGAQGSGPPDYEFGILPGGNEASGYAINESDEVVGYSQSSQGDRAFYWSNSDGMIDLNDYIHSDSGWTLQYAKGINESGQIVGYGINPDGQARGFLLTRECQYNVPNDMNDDCKFDMYDFAILSNYWLIDCGKEPLDPNCVLK